MNQELHAKIALVSGLLSALLLGCAVQRQERPEQVDAAAVVQEKPAQLTPLKPISDGPFPEATQEADVCEAIASQEENIWQRFGHFLPVYYSRTLFIVSLGEAKLAEVERFLDGHMGEKVGAVACDKSRQAILSVGYWRRVNYSRKVSASVMPRLGIAEDIRYQLFVRFGVATKEVMRMGGLKNSKVLGEYCEQSAELCERLLKLGTEWGLCSYLLSAYGEVPPEMTRCLKLDRAKLACRYYNYAPTLEGYTAETNCGIRINNLVSAAD